MSIKSITTLLHRRRQWHPTPVLLPGKAHGRRSLVGCSPSGRYKSDMTERLHFHFSLSHIGEGNSNPLQCSCCENPRDGGAWWAAIYGIAQGRSRLRWLSSSSNTIHCVQVPRKNYKTYKRVENTGLILRDQVSNTARFWYSWYVRIIRLWKFKTTMINIRTPIK